MTIDLTLWVDLRSLQTAQAVAGVIPRITNGLAAYGPEVITREWTLANRDQSGDTGVIGFVFKDLPEDPGGYGLARSIVEDFWSAAPSGLEYGLRVDAENAEAGDLGAMNFNFKQVGTPGSVQRQDAQDQLDSTVLKAWETVAAGEPLDDSPTGQAA